MHSNDSINNETITLLGTLKIETTNMKGSMIWNTSKVSIYLEKKFDNLNQYPKIKKFFNSFENILTDISWEYGISFESNITDNFHSLNKLYNNHYMSSNSKADKTNQSSDEDN